jgi:hypothetical protein
MRVKVDEIQKRVMWSFLKRLKTFAYGDPKSSSLPSEVQSFQQAMESMPTWSEPGAFVSFRDDDALAGSLVQCFQSNRLCSRRASIVLQHYLVCKTKREIAGMVDLTLWKRSEHGVCDMVSRLFGNGQDDSFEVLASLLVEGTKINYRSPSEITETFLRNYGPCLVSDFTVYEDFLQSPRLEFCGIPDARAHRQIGEHAMVLVGTRTDQAGERHFLLQNWWATKQFIDVDETYLNRCNAMIYYVVTPQDLIPEHFPIHCSVYVRNVFDQSERPKNET